MKKNSKDTDIETLRIQLEKAEREYDEAFDNLPPGLDFKGLDEAMRVIGNKVAKLSRQYRMVKPYKLSEIPEYGDRMSLKEFVLCCESGGFIDYDGYGHYVEDGKETDIDIYPSDVKHKSIRNEFKEVIWYNR